jgi:hypothetical protein
MRPSSQQYVYRIVSAVLNHRAAQVLAAAGNMRDNGCMHARRNAPLRPETWAKIMLAILAACTCAMLGLFAIGAIGLGMLVVMLLLLALATVSVVARYLSSPQKSL